LGITQNFNLKNFTYTTQKLLKVINFTPWLLYPQGKNTEDSTNRRLRSTGLAPLILNPDAIWRQVISTMPTLPHKEQNVWYPLNRKLGRPTAMQDILERIKISQLCTESHPRSSIL
jgi:hypothetical protein